MKKYFKSSQSTEEDSNTMPTPAEDSEIEPPLPSYPPPDIQIKQEVVDESYENKPSVEPEPNAQENDPNKPEGQQQEKEIMCKNFFRGVCKRGAACIFVHKVILSQLADVYRFCNDYQNSKCTRPKCRFVHATVFEKEHFLRTGYLPPHAFDHVKDTNKPAQTAPVVENGPPEDNTEVQQQEYNVSVSAVVPAVPAVSAIPTVPAVSAVPTVPAVNMSPSMLPQPAAIVPLTSPASLYTSPSTTPVSSSSAGWSDFEENLYTPSITCTKERPCKECDINEFRLLYYKNKLKNLNKTNDEIDARIRKLESKAQRMSLVLEAIFKPLNMGQISPLQITALNGPQAMSNLQLRLALYKMKRGKN